MEVLKISSKSNPNSVAGAIAGLVKESNQARMQAIGAGALIYVYSNYFLCFTSFIIYFKNAPI